MNRRMWLNVGIVVVLLGMIGGGTAIGKATPTVGIVINEDGNSITVIDPATDRVVTTHDLNGTLTKPHLAAWDAATQRLYVGNKGSNLVVLDMSNPLAPQMVANLKPGGDGEIHRVELVDGRVWLAHEGDSAVYAYDLDQLTTPVVSLGKEHGFNTTHGLTLRPGTHELWTTNRPKEQPGFVLRIDAHTGTVIGQPLPTTGQPGDRPNNVGFSPDGRWAYVPNTGSQATEITVIDAARFEVVGQITQDAARGRAPHSITYEPRTGRVFVPNRDSTTVVAIDVATNRIVGYVDVGHEPHYASLGPDGQLYTAVKHDNKVVVFNPGTLEVVTEIVDSGIIGPHHIIFTSAPSQHLPGTGVTFPGTWIVGLGVLLLGIGLVLWRAGQSWRVEQ